MLNQSAAEYPAMSLNMPSLQAGKNKKRSPIMQEYVTADRGETFRIVDLPISE